MTQSKSLSSAGEVRPPSVRRASRAGLRVSAPLVCLALALILGGAWLLPPGPLRQLLYLAFSGAAPALILSRRWRFTAWIGVSVTLSLAMWSVSAAALWTLGGGRAIPLVPVAAALGCAGYSWLRPRARSVYFNWTGRDTAAALLTLTALPLLGLVQLSNGEFPGPGGKPVYLARAWFAEDAFYLSALAQQAAERSSLPTENPFLAGAPNHYRNLIHTGLGALLRQGDAPAPVALLRFSLFVFPAGWLLLIHALGRRSGTSPGRAGQILLLGAAWLFLAPRLDLFLFPQTQAFAIPFLFLMLAAAGPLNRVIRPKEIAALGSIALFLIFSHTVLGSMALMVLFGEALRVWFEHPAGRRRCAAVLGALLLGLGALFVAINRLPAPSPRGGALLSESIVPVIRESVLPWLPCVAALAAVCLFAALLRVRGRWFLAAAAGALLLGFYYFSRSLGMTVEYDRWFVVVNVSRFFHLALLLALPGILAHVSGRQRAAALGLLALAVAFRGSAIPSAFTQLVDNKPFVVASDWLAAYDRIRRSAPPDSRIAVPLETGWSLPAFTGRPAFKASRGNGWGMNTVTEAEFQQANADYMSLYADGTPPEERLRILESRGVDLLLWLGRYPGEIAADAAVRSLLPPASAEREFSNGSVLLIRLK